VLVDDAETEVDLVGLFEVLESVILAKTYWDDSLGSILKTLEKASSACSKDPYRSYRIPIPYHSFGS